MIYQIKNKFLTVNVNSFGCEMINVFANGKERLWQNENGSWGKHAPLLFPHAGKCSIIIDGKRYKDHFHGFARDFEWSLVSKTGDEITMVFTQNEETKLQYPYDFEFYTTYKLVDNSIVITNKVINKSNKEMYFAFGAHESYKVDKLSNYYLKFEKEEKPFIDAFITAKTLDLATKYLDNDETIKIYDVNSRYVELVQKGTNKVVASTRFEEFPNLFLWHSLGSEMICIEPWINRDDSEEDDKKEFKDKKHIIRLSKGEEKSLIRTIYYY